MLSTKISTILRLLLLCIGVFPQSGLSAQQPDSAQDLVERMFDASKKLSYNGVFTYEIIGDRRTVKVSHQVVDGVIYERATYMDGPTKERVRRSAVDQCQPVDFHRPSAQDSYRFNIIGESRVAGREAYRVQVLPKDNLRFGYLYAIDQQTGLMLQSILVDQSGRSLEHFKYVDIGMGLRADDWSAMAASADAQATVDCGSDSDKQPWQWSVAWVPPGFVQVSRKVTENHRQSIVYTDGISVFSVLIDTAPEVPEYPTVSARLGPTQMVVVNRELDNRHYRIAVSGQLPQVTANQIVLSVSAVVAGDPDAEVEAIH